MTENSQIFPRNRGRFWFDLVMAVAFAHCAPPARAHSPDTSYLRCTVAPHELGLRFTFDLATLHQIVRPDADGDGEVTRAEMDAVTPEIFEYLESSVQLEVNGEPVKLGERAGLGWPAEGGDAIVEKDYHTQLLHFAFRRPSKPMIEDIYMCQNVFEELGDRHRIIQDIEQDGRHHEVIYTMFEPDYLYDTFWKPDTRELFRGYMAAVWGSPVLVLVFLPSIILCAFRCPRVLTLLAAVPGFAGLLWQLRGDLRPGSVLTFVSGTGVAALLGAMAILPAFLGIFHGGGKQEKKTAPPEQAQQRSG